MLKITEENRKWWSLVALTSAISMIFLDITVLPVTLPTIQRQLELTEVGMQWIVNIYILLLTIFLLAGGRIGDRFGHRKIFCWGLILFAVSSALCGLSHSEEWFIGARFLQGIGGALLIPSSTTLNFNAFPPHQRGKAMGLYVSIGSIFLALGPFLGGVFTEYLTWRLVFWINLPIALIGLIMTLGIIPKSKQTEGYFDGIGFVLFSIGITAIVIALMHAKSLGWSSFLTIGLFLFGIFLLFLLWKVDRKVPDPYIDFSLFRNRDFIVANAGIFCTQFILMISLFWTMYFQNALGYTPSEAGLLSLISNLPIMLAAPLGGHLLDKKGPRLPMGIGFLLVIVSLFWLLQHIETKNTLLFISGLIPFGFGIPFIFTPSYATAMAELKPERRGLASGTISTIRQMGGTLGIAILGALFFNLQEVFFAKDLKQNIETETLVASKFQGLLAKAPDAIETLEKLPETSQAFVKKIYLHSYIEGFLIMNYFAIGVAVIGLCLVLFLIKKKTQPDIEL